MTTFEEQFAAARHNAFYWMSWVFMLVLPVVGAAAAGLLLKKRWARHRVYVVLAIACFLGTAELTVMAIEEKWQRRFRIETTTEAEGMAKTADGANRMAAPFIGGFCGVVAVLLMGATGLVVGRVKPPDDARTPAATAGRA